MSDAMTDIARDERRTACYAIYLKELLLYIKNKKHSKSRFEKLEEAAKNVDDVPRGYYGSKAGLNNNLKERVNKLRSGDKGTWSRLLIASDDFPEFKEFKEISPFKDKILIEVDYGLGFVTLKSEDLQAIIDKLLRENDMCTYDADKYMIALSIDKENLQEEDVTWLRCGYLNKNISGPSKKERERIRSLAD